MNDQLKRYIDPIKKFWNHLSKKKKTIIISCLAGVIVLAVALELILSLPKYSVLYSGLDDDEASEVMEYLDNDGASYKEDDGTIYVLEDEEDALRMELANEGYPTSTLNYDFFTENVDVMTTDYEKKIIEKYQLNERLATVIKTFDSIENATVTINVPDTDDYAWESDDSSTSSASVTVTLKKNETLSATQVNGIKQLVAKSVPDLTVDNVAVIDTATGEELSASSDEETTTVDITEFKLAVEKEYESSIVASVKSILTPIFGDGNVKVTAKSIMDVDKKVKEAITYLPSSDDSNTGVISEASTSSEKQTSSGTDSDTTGTETNTEDTTTYTGVTTDGDTIYYTDEATYTYLVSQVTEQIESDAASLSDLTISVAINQETMSDEQKEQIAKLVANSAAVDAEKVVVYAASFYTAPSTVIDTGTDTDTGNKLEVNIFVIAAGVAVVGLLFLLMMIFLLMSRIRKKKLKKLLAAAAVPAESEAESEEVEETVPVEEDEAAKQRRALEAVHAAQQTKAQELRHDLQEFSNQNPEIVAQLIKAWVRGEDNDG